MANDWRQSYLFAFPATVYTVQVTQGDTAVPSSLANALTLRSCAVQNNLSFYAMKFLDAPTYMVRCIREMSLPRGPQCPALAEHRSPPVLCPRARTHVRTGSARPGSAAPETPLSQVLSQAKILTTAIFTVVLLGRRLHRVRWRARPPMRPPPANILPNAARAALRPGPAQPLSLPHRGLIPL